jgi:hypothetical protein
MANNNAMMYAIAAQTQAMQQQAERQAAEQRRYNEQQTRDNRPTQNTEFGSSTWSQDANGNWTNNVSMNPADKARLDQQRALASSLLGQAGQTSNKLMDSINQDNPQVNFQSTSTDGLEFNPQFNQDYTQAQWNDVADSSQAQADAAYGRMMELSAPQIAEQRRQFSDQLTNQGLSMDSAQYQAGMRNLEDSLSRNRLQTMNSAMGEGRAQGEYDINRALSNQRGFTNAGTYNMDQALKQQSGQINDFQGVLAGRQAQSGINSANTAGQSQVLNAKLAGQTNLVSALNALNGGAGRVGDPNFNSFNTASQNRAADLNGISQWGVNQGMNYMDMVNSQPKKQSLGGVLGGVAGNLAGQAAGGWASGGFKW